MIEIKVMFKKSGVTGYYKLELGPDESIDSYINNINTCMLTGQKTTLEVIEPHTNMKTIIDMTEVASFGYKEIIENDIQKEIENHNKKSFYY